MLQAEQPEAVDWVGTTVSQGMKSIDRARQLILSVRGRVTVEGIPGWWLLAIFVCYALIGLSLLPAFASAVLLLAGRPQQALRLFAAALLFEAVVWAAFCLLLSFGSSVPIGLTSLSLLLAGAGQFIAVLRSPRTYAVALGFAVAAVLVIVAGTPIVYRLGLAPQWEWQGMPAAGTSLCLAVTSLIYAALVLFGSRRPEPEAAEGKSPARPRK
jgi:hypothetical protein